MGNYIDFRWIVEQADVPAVLSGLGVRDPKPSGDGAELRFSCPLHEDKRPSASINVATRKVLCHSCGVRGDILELVAQTLGTSKRDAAAAIAEWSGSALAPPRDTQNGHNAPAAAPRATAEPVRSSGRQTGRVKPLMRRDSPPGSTEGDGKEWQPYRKALALDVDHAFGERFTAESIETFRMGYQSKGMFQGRWCIPIDDADGEQLGYIGRHVGKQTPRDAPKWLIPEGFPKMSVLFNLHRLLDEHGRLAGGRVIVTEGPTDVIRLHSLHLPAVGLLGHAIGGEQLALLERCEVAQVLLLFDGDDPGRAAAPAAVEALSQVAYVRNLVLPGDGDDAESVDVAFLEDQVWW
ncbi:MAG: toprim domain-containing protein [Gammaproteobacteria bacterium]